MKKVIIREQYDMIMKFKGTETLIKLYDENTTREEMYLKNIKYKANRNIKPRKEDNEITKN